MSELSLKNEADIIKEYKISHKNELLNEIISKYKLSVEIIASKYVTFPMEKDDLVQEGMIGLLAAINSYNEEKGALFSTYSKRCIENSIQSAIRKFSRMKDIPQNNLVSFDDENVEAQISLSAEDEFLAKESVSNLSKSLYEDLSKFENEVLRLFIVGCSYTEIATKLDKNPKAIDNAIQRIRKKLYGVAF